MSAPARTLLLAPMEGVMDSIFRDVITSLGGVDQATTEFLRVTDLLLPEHMFYKYAPELRTNSRTRSGTPVFVQLLGGQPGPMAENAARAAELGAAGIDLNFGCPAKTVNRHDGGASLLQYPERIHKIVSAVRSAVPAAIPVTVKMRLGFASTELCLDNARAAEAGGALRLTVHARLKTDGYKPPAFWEWIPQVQAQLKIPVVANGEIWNRADLDRCARETGCTHFMVGRGVLQNPYLFQELRGHRPQSSWSEARPLVIPFFEANAAAISPLFAQARTKQWLKLMSRQFPEAVPVFDQLKVHHDPLVFRRGLEILSGGVPC